MRLPENLAETFVTVTAIFEDGEDSSEDAIREVIRVLSKNYEYYELLIVDNSSTKDPSQLVRELQKDLPNIRLLVLSRHYDKEVAIAAALDNSLGDYVVLMDILYDSPGFVPTLVNKAMGGYDAVIAEGIGKENQGFLEPFLRRVFYKLSNWMLGYQISPYDSYFRAFSRRFINSISQIKNKTRYLKYLNAFVGFKEARIPYERKGTKVKSPAKSLLKSIALGIELLVAHSNLPLRIAVLLGLGGSFLSFIYILYVFAVALLKQKVVEGWISTSLLNASMFFLLFLVLMIISEYISKILEESKDQPLYFISEEYNSSVLASKKEKVNVV